MDGTLDNTKRHFLVMMAPAVKACAQGRKTAARIVPHELMFVLEYGTRRRPPKQEYLLGRDLAPSSPPAQNLLCAC